MAERPGCLGQSIPRREDRRLVTGTGCYVADVDAPGVLDVAFLRSPVPHGAVRSVDRSRARAAAGVVGAWAAKDLPDLPVVPPSGPRQTPEGPAWPALASDRVRYVGEPLAVVAAENRYAAEDGVDAVIVDIEQLPAVVDPTEAAAPDAPRLFDDTGNVIKETSFGAPVPDETWSTADVVVEARYREQLLAPTSIEARAVLVRPEPEGGLTVWCSHQAPHRLRDGLAGCFGLSPEQVRVLVPDVGGAFGAKSQTYPEYVVVARLARLLGRPVRWIEDRVEALTAATRGRGQNQRVRLAADADGRILALETRIDAGLGPYPHTGGFVPEATAYMAPGAYRIPEVLSVVRTVATNTAPTSPYRGAGRPEAAYAIERTVDLLARRLGMDPAQVRRRNFVPREAFPYRTPTDRVYDSGNYDGALDRALAAVGYERWRAEQSRRRASGNGPPLGIGICSYVERAGGSPGMPEYGSVEACADGTFVARSGSCSTGQGHETTFAQVVASALGVEIDAVRVLEADTHEVTQGVGSFGSRSMQVGGSALHRAALGLVDEARRRVADRTRTPVEQVTYEAGTLVADATSLSLAELVTQSGPLRVDDVFGPPQAFPFGCYVAVVEVEPDLGNVRVLRLVAVDDYGVVVNPMVTHGQTYGSIVQGLGQALYEEMHYDGEGRPGPLTLFDDLLPTIAEVPDVTLLESETPNPNVPLGAKGAGEAGCIGVPPAIVNAVADALDLDQPDVLQMPVTPEACWEAAGRPETIR